jgi:hypothetical protein
MSTYYIYPAGTPSHTAILYARYTGGAFPSGKTVAWRKNGLTIKSGSSDDASSLVINSGIAGDVSLWAGDTGTTIDFTVDGPATVSDGVILANQRPTVSASTLTDAYLKSPPWPSFAWTFTDADGDSQYFYRARLGSLPNTWDIWDTGQVLSSSARSFVLPHSSPYAVSGLPYGSKFYWTINVSDGEKNVPTDPDITTNRWVATATGAGFVTILPNVGEVLVNGVAEGKVEVPLTAVRNGLGVVVDSQLKPTISWNYSDIDGQPQAAYRIVVSSVRSTIASMKGDGPVATSDDVFWDSGQVYGPETSATYGNAGRRTAKPLTPYSTLYVGVSTSDGIAWSPFESPE